MIKNKNDLYCIALATLLVMLSSVAALAQDSTNQHWTFSQDNAQAHIKMQNAQEESWARFEIFEGEVVLNETQPLYNKAKIAFDLNSIQSDDPKWQEQLAQQKALKTEDIKKCEIEVTQISKTQDSKYIGNGVLKINDMPLPIMLPFTIYQTRNEQQQDIIKMDSHVVFEMPGQSPQTQTTLPNQNPVSIKLAIAALKTEPVKKQGEEEANDMAQ